MITPKITNLGYSNLWTDMSTILGYTLNFEKLIAKLFANNEQGFAYNPNDLTTMFQDAAGTKPVTAAGQPVGLMLDKRKGLASTSVLAQQDTFTFYGLGTIPPTATSSSAEFLNKACVSVTFPTIGAGGYAISRAQGAQHTITAGKFYKYLYKVALSRKLTAGESIQVYATGSNGTSTTTLTQDTQDNTWLDFSSLALVNVSGSNSFTIFALQTNAPVTVYATAFSLSTLDIGNHAYQTTSASRPILRQNATTGSYYLEFDGSDDFLVTNNIDFTSTDKVSLFAGVRKLSDAAAGMVFELSSSIGTSNGVFNLAAPSVNQNPEYVFSSKGTATSTARATGFTAPISSVVSAIGDIPKPRVVIRVNGVVKQEKLLSQGTGNYGNQSLYIGRRGGVSVPFNGHIYGIICIGKLVSDSETTAIEKEIAKRVGVTLNV